MAKLDQNLTVDQTFSIPFFVAQEATEAAFNACNQYADTFEPYRDFFKENESCDLEVVRSQEHDVPFFSEALGRYHHEHKMAELIIEKRPIGMLLVDATKMKGLMIPSPLRCLDVSHKTGVSVNSCTCR